VSDEKRRFEGNLLVKTNDNRGLSPVIPYPSHSACGNLATNSAKQGADMPFVFEPISDADLLRINFAQQLKELSDYGYAPREWVIDRERNIYLVCYATRSGDPERRPSQFGFGYKGSGITELRVLESGKNNQQGTSRQLTYQILPIIFRPQFEERRDAMLPLIEEAMVAYGTTRMFVTSVDVQFL
jgi:hypothetical protein